MPCVSEAKDQRDVISPATCLTPGLVFHTNFYDKC